MSETFDVKVEKRTNFAILRTEGYVNNLGGEKISEKVDELIEAGIINFVINFEKSNVVNSIGISILIEVIEKLVDIEGKIFFTNLTKTINKTFSIMGLTQFAEIRETEEEAINEISK
ncbi:MAG: STAS domain-containing protein [Candidatus Sericytochromatia bacterium]